MPIDTVKKKEGASLIDTDPRGWSPMLDALPRRLRHFENATPRGDGRVDGHTLHALLRELLDACGGNLFEWISTQSPRPTAPWGTPTALPTDWRAEYRWLEVSVVHGCSEGWVVHVRGVLRGRQEDGLDPSELLITAKCFDRHYAWRAAQLLSEFFDS